MMQSLRLKTRYETYAYIDMKNYIDVKICIARYEKLTILMINVLDK